MPTFCTCAQQIGENLSFADLAVAKSLEHNRSLAR